MSPVDGDGWRDLPDGKPLKLAMGSDPSALLRQYDELWQRSMSAVGIRIEFVKQKWPDLLKMARYGQLQMWALGNINTTPEGFGFMSLLYGPHAGFSNLSRFNLPEFNRLYEQGAEAARRRRAHAAVQTDVRTGQRLRAVGPQCLSCREHSRATLGPWLTSIRCSTGTPGSTTTSIWVGAEPPVNP